MTGSPAVPNPTRSEREMRDLLAMVFHGSPEDARRARESVVAEHASLAARLVAAEARAEELRADNERLRGGPIGKMFSDELEHMRHCVEAERVARSDAEAELVDAQAAVAAGLDWMRKSDALAARVAAVEKLCDEWLTKYGPESSAWKVFGQQTVSIPFAVEQIRAALASAPTPPEPPWDGKPKPHIDHGDGDYHCGVCGVRLNDAGYCAYHGYPAAAPTPEKPTCEHNRTEPHDYEDRMPYPLRCPGPAAVLQPKPEDQP